MSELVATNPRTTYQETTTQGGPDLKQADQTTISVRDGQLPAAASLSLIAALEARFVGKLVTVVTAEGDLFQGLAYQVVSEGLDLALWIQESGRPVPFRDIRQLSVLAA